MALPAPLAILAWEEIRNFAKEKDMPFITGADIVGRQEALAEGLAQGLAQGLEQGRQQAREDLLAGIEAVLDVKFAGSGLALLPEIRQIEDLELLRKTLQAAKQADNPEGLRRLWANA